ncbi:MAG: hypothetical protein K6F00_08345 [Lachnospiraceae bacterium]|nr:hypothetical protein [Lachnospiraceae bacterium]
MKKRVFMVAVTLMAFSMAACSTAKPGEADKKADTKESQVMTTEGHSEDEVLEHYAGSIEDSLKEHYGENYKVERDGLFVNASVWKDGVADTVQKATEGDEAAKKEWEKEIKELEALSKDLSISMEATGVKNGHTVLSMMDDTNDKRMFAMLSDGTVIFNEVASAEEVEKAAQEAENKTQKAPDDKGAKDKGAKKDKAADKGAKDKAE